MATRVSCKRCGGRGGWEGWPGFTCYRCHGTGQEPHREGRAKAPATVSHEPHYVMRECPACHVWHGRPVCACGTAHPLALLGESPL